ncbi:MAG: hypothetical protein Q4F70_00530 [Clostridia bacterium]|nr:hypothetical protein [Clostridia bacterium]
MVSNKDALQTLIKSIDGTMAAAKFALTSAKAPEELADPITYEGEYGEVELKIEENVLNVNCKALGTDWKTVTQTLFDPSEEEWDDKATKSTANAICEAVSTYYGTECVFPGKAAKAASGSKKDAKVIAVDPQENIKKSKKKEAVASYEPEALAIRMENIFQDLKGEMVNNIEKYEIFLPEEYFETLVTPRILEAIKLNDRPTLKKIFNTFNNFYDEGDNNMQSLIVVSILGMNLAKDDTLLEKCESFMDDNLKAAVTPVVTYLKTGKGAGKRIGFFNDPKTAKIKSKKK